jgi:hypothetical protein
MKCAISINSNVIDGIGEITVYPVRISGRIKNGISGIKVISRTEKQKG